MMILPFDDNLLLIQEHPRCTNSAPIVSLLTPQEKPEVKKKDNLKDCLSYA